MIGANGFRIWKKYSFVVVLGVVCAFLFFSVLWVSAETHKTSNDTITTCAYLADGAVYQANKPTGIWGTANKGAKITAKLYKDSTLIAESSSTAVDGNWRLELPGQTGSYETYTIKLSVNGAVTAEYSGILFGEVWLSAGQSNMQLRVCDSYGGEEQMKAANDAYLRVFIAESLPTSGFSTPATDVTGEWLVCDKGRFVGRTSAVAYNFALKLRRELDVPVAVLDVSLGDTPIEAWITKEMVNTDAQLRADMEYMGLYATEAMSHRELGAMCNSKVAPLTNTTVAGVIWYQGESNVQRATIYAKQLDILKNKWGEAFGFADDSMPFIFSQLAPYTFGTDNRMLLTEMMEQFSLFYSAHETTVGMVTNYDLSLRYEDALTTKAVIHPTLKQPVGERMALSALGLVYGGDEATAPTLSSCEIVDGVAVLTFSHVGDGLKLTDESMGTLGFALCDENGTWVNATAEIINSNTVFVYSDLMQKPVYVSYAYCDMNIDANLCASNGIPVAPFSTGGAGGLGSRSYLNCDEELFVTTSFETVGDEVGHAEYQNPWTITNRSEISFDHMYCKQGTASVKVDYETGDGDVVAGMDLQGAGKYSATIGLEGIKSLSVKMSNADKQEKVVRLMVKTQDGTILVSKPQTLQADANFTTLVFNFKILYRENGVQEPYPRNLIKDMIAFGFYIDDAESGTIWIDDIKLGVDEYWEPDLEVVMNKLGLQREYVSKVNKDVRETTNILTMKMIVGIGVALVGLMLVIIFLLVMIKRSRISIE